MSRTTDMTTGNPRKHILSFAFPLIVTNLGQQLYMIADGAIVGRGVGVKALAAVGATDWIYWLILWTAIGLTQGFSTFVSRYFGHKDYHSLNKTLAMSTLLCVVTSIILTIAEGPQNRSRHIVGCNYQSSAYKCYKIGSCTINDIIGSVQQLK